MSENNKVIELLLEACKSISTEIELKKVVQNVVDIATRITGAQFGAFFYNEVDQKGDSLLLYTVSGFPKEAFSSIPNPPNPKFIELTFAGAGTVRYSDVTKENYVSENALHNIMLNGNLPVKSYLATPVVSLATKEVIGGLFFGHDEAGNFSKESEKLIEGIAVQAAVALRNALLFEQKTQTEKSLVEDSVQYKSIFDAISDAIIVYDKEGIITEANPAASEMLGFSHQQLIGKGAKQLYVQAKDLQTTTEVVLSGRKFKGLTKLLQPGDRFLEVGVNATNFLFKGQPHVMLILKEVGHEQKTAVALEKSEELTQTISAASPVTLWMTDRGGATNFINQTWLDWVGGKLDDHLGVGWLSAIVKEDRDHAKNIFLRAFEDRRVFSTDFRIRRKSGELRWCSTHGTPYNDKYGRFAGYAGSLTDITERKLTEEKLASQNLLFNSITNNTQQALFLMNAQQICMYMNPAAEQMTGFTLDEVREKPLHYYVHHTHPDGRHFPIEECAIDRALPTEMHTQGEEVFIHKKGHFYPVAFTASPIIENGVPIGTVIEARDTTEEKRVAQALRNKEKEAMAMLEQSVRERTMELEKSNYELMQFASVASHDLKEPIRKISIFSARLQENLANSIDKQSNSYLDKISKASIRMTRLINDLLGFSRLSYAIVEFGLVDLNEILAHIVEDLEIQIEEKNATVSYGSLPTVVGIQMQLNQVFQNLISNSLKFSSPDRIPHIDIQCEKVVMDELEMYKITYKDNGIGFSDEQAEKIFNLFYRLHSKNAYDGTGIGLSIVSKIISIHHGTIKAFGSLDQGATFEILLPQKAQSIKIANG